ncbi:MAG: hypothetical protein KC492_27865, partial [Myxococcales bacterium]|nr:hypothetical protein [Myxococcales bacterium]
EVSGVFPDSPPLKLDPVLLAVLLSVGSLVLSVGFFYWSFTSPRRKAAVAYRQALQQTSPAAVLALLDQENWKLFSDGDALRAQATANAYAIFGDPERAREAVSSVDWASRAPLIQSLGLNARCLVTLLGEHNASTALSLARRARSLAEISGYAPGAKEAATAHATFVAVCEACNDSLSADSLAQLEASAQNQRQPLLQVLAYYALAIQLARDGESAAALRAQAKLLELAPHAAGVKLWD